MGSMILLDLQQFFFTLGVLLGVLLGGDLHVHVCRINIIDFDLIELYKIYSFTITSLLLFTYKKNSPLLPLSLSHLNSLDLHLKNTYIFIFFSSHLHVIFISLTSYFFLINIIYPKNYRPTITQTFNCILLSFSIRREVFV